MNFRNVQLLKANAVALYRRMLKINHMRRNVADKAGGAAAPRKGLAFTL